MQNILVAIDFSNITAQLLRHAESLARAHSAKIWLIHVASPDPDFVGYEAGPQTVRNQVAARLQNEHRQLQTHADELRQNQIDATPLLVQGPTTQTILSEAQRLHAELIILGSHGHGALYRALVGTVTEGVLRKSSCPVLIVPANPSPA